MQIANGDATKFNELYEHTPLSQTVEYIALQQARNWQPPYNTDEKDIR